MNKRKFSRQDKGDPVPRLVKSALGKASVAASKIGCDEPSKNCTVGPRDSSRAKNRRTRKPSPIRVVQRLIRTRFPECWNCMLGTYLHSSRVPVESNNRNVQSTVHRSLDRKCFPIGQRVPEGFPRKRN